MVASKKIDRTYVFHRELDIGQRFTLSFKNYKTENYTEIQVTDNYKIQITCYVHDNTNKLTGKIVQTILKTSLLTVLDFDLLMCYDVTMIS